MRRYTAGRAAHPALLLLIAGALAALPAGPVAAAPATEEDSCMLCHSDETAGYEDDIHARRGIVCSRCHGGDPGSFSVEGAKAAGTGYRGRISREEGVRLCASCHSDEVMMRQYGLSTDQFAQYATSRHGRLLLEEGNGDVATCIDCHGVHGILPPSDPASRVFRRNLPATCAECHSDEVRMAPYAIPTNQLEDYLASIHGIELIRNNNRAAPDCARCHGVHGARAPGTTEVYNVCGHCHPFIQEQFMKSPHFGAEKAGELEGCVACHGNHRIIAADTQLLVDSCRSCHEEGSAPALLGVEMKSMIDAAWDRYREGEAELERANVEGLDIIDEEMMMEEAHTLLVRLKTAQHTLDLETVEEDVAKVVSMINNVIATLEHDLVSIRIYKLVLIPIWGFLAGMILLFYRELKSVERKRAGTR
jgi:hypothetical protein